MVTLSLPGTCRLPREQLGGGQPPTSLALLSHPRMPLSLLCCEGFHRIQAPPAWGFDDSPASSAVGNAPTQEWQHPGLGLPSQSAFSKDSPLEVCATCCRSNRQFSVVLGNPSGNASNNCRCGGGRGWVLASLPRLCQTRVPRIRSITHTSAAAALCRVGLSRHASPGPCTRLYKTEGFLALAAEGKKSRELVTQDKTAPH